jgi:hypothetical protein
LDGGAAGPHGGGLTGDERLGARDLVSERGWLGEGTGDVADASTGLRAATRDTRRQQARRGGGAIGVDANASRGDREMQRAPARAAQTSGARGRAHLDRR